MSYIVLILFKIKISILSEYCCIYSTYYISYRIFKSFLWSRKLLLHNCLIKQFLTEEIRSNMSFTKINLSDIEIRPEYTENSQLYS